MENNFIKGLSYIELRRIKYSLKCVLLDLTKDLKKSISNFEYDEIQINLNIIDDYFKVLEKVSRTLQHGGN